MSTTDEACRLADLLSHLQTPVTTQAAVMLHGQAEQIERLTAEVGRLNALAGPGGKSLGELERLNDDFIEENERLTAERDSLRAELRAREDQKDGYDIMGLAEEQRQNPGPFGAPGMRAWAAKDPT